MSYQFSLAYLTVMDVSPPEAVRIAAETGYSHIGFRLLPASTEGPFPIMSDAALFKETQQALLSTGVQLADIEIVRINEQFDLSSTDAFLYKGQQLGAKNILVAGDDPDELRCTDNFGRFCEQAAAFGMTADLEFMPWTQVPNLEKAHRIVQAVNQPNAGILIDALHYHRAGVQPEAVAAINPEYLHYVQFCDAPAEFDPDFSEMIRIARDARMNPGEGGIDLAGLLAVLPADMLLSIEVPSKALHQTLSAKERAARALAGMQKVIASLRT